MFMRHWTQEVTQFTQVWSNGRCDSWKGCLGNLWWLFWEAF